ncbi:MAG: monovalent cation/H(+) antiporter subunit G [Firmicutes bacterium]|nr:monovalent cation/H(+) antiporter subunit G [Bacillota bacterium]
MEIKTIVTGVLLGIGCFLIVVASLGVVRFPDFYSRIHPAGKCDTLGQMFILLGLMVYNGFSLNSIKLLIIMVFMYVANPTATHFIVRAAYLAGVKPWKRT